MTPVASVRHALARLRARRGRALLAAGGVAAAAAMLGSAVTVADSLAGGFDRAAARAGLADVVVSFDEVSRRVIAPRIAALPNVRAVAYRLGARHQRLFVPGHANYEGIVEGVRPGRRGYAIVAGRDLSGGPDEVVVDRGLARAWGIRPGGQLIAGYRALRVVGIAVEPDNVAFPLVNQPRVWVPDRTAASLAGTTAAATNELLLWARDPARLDVTLAQARAQSFGLTDVRILTRSGVRLVIGQAAGIVIAILVAVSLVALAAAGAMLSASAAADVQRRLPQIGIMRAVGASRSAVAASQALEALLVAVPAATVGLAVGWLAVQGPTDRLLLALNELGPGSELVFALGLTLLGICVVVACSAAVPAWRAAARRPVDSLRGGDVVAAARRAPLPSGPGGLGVRLVLARPARTATAVAALGVSASFVLLVLAVASLLARLERDPQAVGRSYELEVSAPVRRVPAIRRLAGVGAAAPRWETSAADSFDLGESFDVVAFGGDHTRFEAQPLAEGRRIRSGAEAEVGLGLAQALNLHPGGVLAAEVAGREVRFRVVGIVRALERQGRVAYVTPGPLVRAAHWLRPTVAVRLSPGASAPDVRRRLRPYGETVASSGGVTGEAVHGWAARNSGFVGVLVALLRAVAVLDGLVCLYALAQVLALTAEERRQAVAVIRAVGGSRGQVRRVFIGAATAVAALAAPVGILLERLVVGPAVSRLAASYVTLPLAAGPAPVALLIGGLLAAALGAAAIVARRAWVQPIAPALTDP